MWMESGFCPVAFEIISEMAAGGLRGAHEIGQSVRAHQTCVFYVLLQAISVSPW